MPDTKESLLKQVDSLRDMARRARSLSTMLSAATDRSRLSTIAEEIDEAASRIEKEAAVAKTMVQKLPEPKGP